MSKRIILVGPTCSGKTFIRDKFREKGYKIDVSYTSRKPRLGEVDGKDYIFLTKLQFSHKIVHNKFYEYVEYNGNYYGTGLDEWNISDIFIMETDGIKHIEPEDRKESLVIYVNTPFNIRLKRMKEREWSQEKISTRLFVDSEKFINFKDYDIEISSGECENNYLFLDDK